MKKLMTKILIITLTLALLLPFAVSCTVNETGTNNDTAGTNPPSDSKAGASVALDLTEEWEAINGENTLVQGCLVVNTAWAAAHPNELAKFLADYSASVEYVKSGSDEAISSIVNAGVLPKAAIAKKALPNCNICCITGDEMKNDVKAMLNVLFEANKQSVGGKLPDDEFYY